jgi:hypothetical protein
LKEEDYIQIFQISNSLLEDACIASRHQPLDSGIILIPALPVLLSFFVSLAVNFEPAAGWKDTDMDPAFETIAMPYQFPVFEVTLKKRSRAWRWCVCTTEGQVVIRGSERRRSAAKYKANRALFLLLLGTPYRGLERRFIAGDKIR